MSGSVSRISLPSEFYDRTSEIVLRQPADEFLYAKLLFGASAKAEIARVGAENFTPAGQSVQSNGAPYPPFSSMQDMLADAVRSDAIMVSDELAQGPGHTIRMNRPLFSGGGYTLASRQFAGNLSLNPISLSDEQVSITIAKFAGPFAAGGTEPQPYAISRFDAQRSVHSLPERVGSALGYDRNAFLDSVFGGYFDSSTTILYPGDSSNLLTSDAAAWPVVPVGSLRPFDLETLLRMEEALQNAKIPRFSNGRFIATLTPKQHRQLLSDPQYQKQSVFLPEKNLLASGGVGTLVVNASIEISVCRTNVVDTAAVSGVSINHAVMFGPGMVGYAPGIDGCRVEQAPETNYNEDVKVLWIAYEGSAVLDNRFGVSAHSD